MEADIEANVVETEPIEGYKTFELTGYGIHIKVKKEELSEALKEHLFALFRIGNNKNIPLLSSNPKN